ncbi:hypothetical protein [Nocardia huaxiensis]|uniref:hypothetical protein n=1 Tax=Nocardia huaxiensis TaxID=2755382 RepID=UPI001E610432|nr:hypothetical protein [Nocardia huaxiensis]UFS99587.1 hypothetical protein LPY97_17715 [Nocardia huaxiensis]
MTSQQPDNVDYNGGRYELVGVRGSRLFDPEELGLELRPLSTACWRGFTCSYAVVDNRLILTNLALSIDNPPDELLGAPVTTNGYGAQCAPNRALIEFTGGLLIGDDLDGEYYIHLGFQPAWTYRTVHELDFVHGQLVHARDLSAEAARQRAAGKRVGPGEGSDPIAWIARNTNRLRGWD